MQACIPCYILWSRTKQYENERINNNNEIPYTVADSAAPPPPNKKINYLFPYFVSKCKKRKKKKAQIAQDSI